MWRAVGKENFLSDPHETRVFRQLSNFFLKLKTTRNLGEG